MTEKLDALADSVARLGRIADGLLPEQVERSAYPSAWSIAQVLSHVGSGAVIATHNFEAAVSGQQVAEGFNQSVWDEWNAKDPGAQVRDAVIADAALVASLEGSSADERERVVLSVGPMELDFDGFVGLRLNEHAVHTWDVAVALDPAAVVAPVPTSVVIDGLEMIARFTAKATGVARTIVVHTTDPDRTFTVTLEPESVGFAVGVPEDAAGASDLELPAEAFIRLVYGRLDPDHTPAVTDPAGVLADLRATYPGF